MSYQKLIEVEITETTIARAHTPCCCNDCGGPTALYMLHDKIWEKAWPEHSDLRAMLKWQFGKDRIQSLELCFSCVGARLGRQLMLEDFSSAPCNQAVFEGHRMGVEFVGWSR